MLGTTGLALKDVIEYIGFCMSSGGGADCCSAVIGLEWLAVAGRDIDAFLNELVNNEIILGFLVNSETRHTEGANNDNIQDTTSQKGKAANARRPRAPPRRPRAKLA